MKLQTAAEFAAEMEALAGTFGQEAIPAALEDCKPLLLAGIDENFSRRGRADGAAWPPRKDPGPSHPLLEETGALRAAATGQGPGRVERIVPVDSGQELLIGVDKGTALGGIPGAAVHQYGYPPKNISEREYLAISAATADACCDVVADYAIAEIGSP